MFKLMDVSGLIDRVGSSILEDLVLEERLV
jgi:hypothetical protein